MQTKIQRIGDSYGLLLPKELLDACGIGEEASVIVQNRTLIVAAPDWHPREGWEEALKGWAGSVADEDEETLAHWASLGEPAPSGKAEPEKVLEAVLRAQPKPYGSHKGQGST